MLPDALQKLVESLSQLSGVGSRTAERYALNLLNRPAEVAKDIASKLDNLHSGVNRCAKTFVFTEPDQDISPHYQDDSRDKRQIVVVEDPFDAIAIEKTGEFRGTYHVLNGLINPLDGIEPDQLTIAQLKERVGSDEVTEIIIATNASVEGESTAAYIKNMLVDNQELSITRLARGIPVGVDIEYTDQNTLRRALEHRQAI